jgi:CPA2 family monovalent cation:H+ antiporter-2
MGHETPLITTIVAGLGLAFLFGAAANRLRLSPLIGYLIAGVVIGPATPGFTADVEIAAELAEIGVILLMFGVGLHFSINDLLSVRRVAVPGALGQIAIATLLGTALGLAFGWSLGAGLIFGFSLSVASTVVLLRALQDRRLIDTHRGKIAVGWLIVEDLATVLALVLLPAIAAATAEATDANGFAASDLRGLAVALGITLGKLAGFVLVMFFVGRRVIPWILHVVAHSGSRELFRLAVLAIALGIAFGAVSLFGISFALGAFFAGVILNESPLSQRAAQESLPLRDAFAVLFFVSVGMLFDPAVLISNPLGVVATVAIIVVGKSVGAYLIVRAFGRSSMTAMTISVSLAQIGEFSFILAALGLRLEILPKEAQDLILAGAMNSIVINPFLFTWLDRRRTAQEGDQAAVEPEPEEKLAESSTLTGHAIIVGYGRVGSLIGDALESEHRPFLVIEDANDATQSLAARGIQVIHGNAARADILAAANVGAASRLFIAIPEAFEAGQIAEQAREANPKIEIIARAHYDDEIEHLIQHGADHVVMGEREIAAGMLKYALGKDTELTEEPSQPSSSPDPRVPTSAT